MRKPSKFEAEYEALAHIASGPMNAESIAELKRAINGRTSLLVSKAADIAGVKGLHDLIPDMILAFDRFMIDGARVDKQCNAKASIANALYKLEYMGDEVFLAGAHCIQMEPVYGGFADTAADLRCTCAYALAKINQADASYILTDMLVDNERAVRIAAVKALAYLGRPESEVLLRLKVLTGDGDPEVIGECFTSLISLAPDRSLDFVARYLQSKDPMVKQSAAISIAQSHATDAFDTLRQCWEDDPSPTTRRMLLLPIALVRTDEAFNFLIDVVRSADNATMAEAISALDLYTDDESIRRTREALMNRQ